MIVECGVCRARYHLRESMMGGFQGAKVRCRKCGDRFVIVNPSKIPGPAFPAAPTAPTSETRSRQPRPPSVNKPGIPTRKEDRSTGNARKVPQTGVRMPPPGTAIAQKTGFKESTSDNVVLLARSRKTIPRRSSVGSFDISGRIRPEPSPPLAKEKPDSPPIPPAAPVKKDSTAGSVMADPVPWHKDEVRGTTGENAIPASGTGHPSVYFLRKRDPRSNSIRSKFPRIFDLSITYLLLLLAGGAGYLVYRLLNLLFLKRFD